MKIKLLNRFKFSTEHKHLDEGFSVLNSHRFKENIENSTQKKSIYYTSFLYLISIISIGAWIISLAILPFGDFLQFLLGAAVLSVNLLVFKWAKI
ncbi:hypothetical protein [Pedobacter cryophilus]|uniref:Uncharacterized protein n=1 Tax=Pedobacter cryophilus TaxID=2571271 RepID=A0A4U1BUE5_9SPHI|nr:hypothetical protein [Pedobacter cryophilus]TKB95978.1 hypothetical protein FA046_14995 [Pedobacter cryophilus]